MLRLGALLVAASHRLVGAQYSTISGHACFRSLEGMTQSMFDLADAHPHLVSIKDIGDSYLKSTGSKNDEFNIDGGYDIFALNVTATGSGSHKSAEKGKALFTSGVHSREYAPPELLMRFVEMLVDGYATDPDITWILHHTEVHAIIYVNPDGRQVAERHRDEYWRKSLNPNGCSSSYGVDINRNFDFMWGEDGSSSDPCESDYHGKSPESEPETRAVAKYAREVFPEGQRKSDPEGDIEAALGDDIMGIFADIHSSGGYVYFPWGHENKRSPDDDALQALGHKIAYYNDYRFWAPGSKDFLYPASGDSSDYMYGALGVASFGLELGEDFYEDCGLFENEVVPINMPVLLLAATIAKKPFTLVKGPDILDFEVLTDTNEGDAKVIVVASDSLMAGGQQSTGNQGVADVRLHLDVHPDDYQDGDVMWEMMSVDENPEARVFELVVNFPAGLSSGIHTLFAQGIDGDGFLGPVSSRFVDVERAETPPPSDGPTESPSSSPIYQQPTFTPTLAPSERVTTEPSKTPTISPIVSPTYAPSGTPTEAPSHKPTISPIVSPTYVPSKNPTKVPSHRPSTAPSIAPTTSNQVMMSNPTFPPTISPITDLTPPTTSEPSTTQPKAPTVQPSASPTDAPTTLGTSLRPTINPTKQSAETITQQPTATPTKASPEPVSSHSAPPTSSPQLPTSDSIIIVDLATPIDVASGTPTAAPSRLDPSSLKTASSSGKAWLSIGVAAVSALLALYIG